MIKIQSDSTHEMISAGFATGFSLVAVDIGDAVYRLITEAILRNKDYCVSSSAVNKIALHRLINVVQMMIELQIQWERLLMD